MRLKTILLSIIFVVGFAYTGFPQLKSSSTSNSDQQYTNQNEELTLLGYNVYRNNIKINSDYLKDLVYIDNVPESGVYSYHITAVYEEGESDASESLDAVIALEATTREYVVFEKGTGTWCQYCPGAALGLEDLLKYGKKVLGIAYHNGDSYATDEAALRLDYYDIEGYPTAYFDGVEIFAGGSHSQSLYSYYLPSYDKRMEVKTSFTMAASGKYTGDQYTASVNIEKISANNSTDLRVMAVVIEDHIDIEWQGQSELNAVARKMVPGASGTNISFSGNELKNIELSFTWDDEWDKDNCTFITFLQDRDTKEIFGATKVELNDFSEQTKTQKEAKLTELPVPTDFKIKYSMMSTRVELIWYGQNDPKWIQWDNDMNANAIGSTSSILDFDVAAKWSIIDVQALKGLEIKKIGFFPTDTLNSCTYSARLWTGSTGNSLVFDTLLEQIEGNKWNIVELEQPFTIDGSKEIWAGYFNDNKKAIVSAGCDAGPAVKGKGDKIRFYDNDVAESWLNYSDYGVNSNWNIKIFVGPYVEPEDTTSITEHIKPEMNIYPNPTQGNVTVSSDNTINTLYVISVNGQVVLNAKPNTNTFNFSTTELTPGVYFAKIITNTGYNFQKLIVE